MRGLDEHEVGDYLNLLADELERRDQHIATLQNEVDRLRNEVQSGGGYVHEQAAAVLRQAQQVADDLLSEAVQRAGQLMTGARAGEAPTPSRSHSAPPSPPATYPAASTPPASTPPASTPPAYPTSRPPSTPRAPAPSPETHPSRVDPLTDPRWSVPVERRSTGRRPGPAPGYRPGDDPTAGGASRPVAGPTSHPAPSRPSDSVAGRRPALSHGHRAGAEQSLEQLLASRGWARHHRGGWEYPDSFQPTLEADLLIHNPVPVETRLEHTSASMRRHRWEQRAAELGLSRREAEARLGPAPVVPPSPTEQAEPTRIQPADPLVGPGWVITPPGFPRDSQQHLLRTEHDLRASLDTIESWVYTGPGSRRAADEGR
jgi:hypothetical protein